MYKNRRFTSFFKTSQTFSSGFKPGVGDAGVLCLCFQPSVFLERRTGELSSMKCQGEFRKCYTMTFYKYAADTFMYFWELIYSSTNARIPVPIGKLSSPKQLISKIVKSLVQDTLKNNPFISLIFFPPNFNFPIRFDYYSRLISKFTSSQFWQTFQFNFTILKFFFCLHLSLPMFLPRSSSRISDDAVHAELLWQKMSWALIY